MVFDPEPDGVTGQDRTESGFGSPRLSCAAAGVAPVPGWEAEPMQGALTSYAQMLRQILDLQLPDRSAITDRP
ncbi:MULTISPECIES: hypothetical protein [Streptomyces]|uniref:Uncharacterized protein n=1 Tax=Streptomyces canarius TaxID=285453 RepID=A0ABQ3CQP2_9ACTN|nr:hypothetical protein [Streptomyces canarius]GHA33876.1 hypothetical protein GCM10010345_43020 [Streptomyces canarius]